MAVWLGLFVGRSRGGDDRVLLSGLEHGQTDMAHLASRYAPPVPLMSDGRWRNVGLTILFLLAIGVGTFLARPFRSAAISFDSQVAVAHFDRIASGRHLEQFLTTTPKPLLTVIYGTLHAITGDWRSIAWATILAFGLGIAGVGLLITRSAGPVAGAFSAVAVLASPTLLFDVGGALATPWALLGWVAAGLALTMERPRYGLAGIALLLASLARLETMVVVALATVFLAGGEILHRPAPRRSWLLPIIGASAFLVMGVHDWLLSGDPMLWSKVAIKYSETTANRVLTAQEVIAFLGGRYAQIGALTVLSVVGCIRLVAARRFAIVIGLIGLGPGIAAFLVVLAARGIFVSERYVAGIDIAVLAASGIGVAGLSIALCGRTRTWLARADGRGVLVISAAATLAVVMTWPRGPMDAALRNEIRNGVDTAIDADRAVAVLRPLLAAATGSPNPAVIVPTPVRPRIAIDLGLPLTAVGGTSAKMLDPSAIPLAPGVIIVHDRRAEAVPSALRALEVGSITVVDGRTIEPLLAAPERGLWIVVVR